MAENLPPFHAALADAPAPLPPGPSKQRGRRLYKKGRLSQRKTGLVFTAARQLSALVFLRRNHDIEVFTIVMASEATVFGGQLVRLLVAVYRQA